MIFVTVGTHEQPFNRLMKEIEYLIEDGVIKEKVVVQGGYSTYVPRKTDYHSFLDYHEMDDTIKNARIVITHGGPASFIDVIQKGKIPIVVPRQSKYHEHINDHQLKFVKFISNRLNNIIPVYNISDLKRVIIDFDKISKSKNTNSRSNNDRFNLKLERIVNDVLNIN
ncbi:glycosyltransferase [Limosilactobacillus ingluviei]|uniref:glycosyltransferase n=1 Tax=Limosilactobacillus ingluviei TaxID=148604 RepID=UPI00195C03B9|nr:glycosyltransferase [Limosilactobacillus ingluviei]MBM6728231.1 glycosyltransferase [Limosilactobacillus ingluviei]